MQHWERLDREDDVISQKLNPEKIEELGDTFTVTDVLELLHDLCGEREQKLLEGLDCKVLRPGKVWQQGKVRVVLEFLPDRPLEPESPLDRIRQLAE